MSKHELYFSKYCKHSSKIIEELNKYDMNNKFIQQTADPSKATEARIAYAVDIARDLAFVGMCLYIFKYPYGKFSLDKKPESTTQASEDQQ